MTTGLLFVIMLSVSGSAFAQGESPCEGISCSRHGQCKVVDDRAVCSCDKGFVSDESRRFCFPEFLKSFETTPATQGNDDRLHLKGESCVRNDDCWEGLECAYGICVSRPNVEFRIQSGLMTRSVGLLRYGIPLIIGISWPVFESLDGSLWFWWRIGYVYFPRQGEAKLTEYLSGWGMRCACGLEWVFGPADGIRGSVGGGLGFRITGPDDYPIVVVGRIVASLYVPLVYNLDFILTTALEGGRGS